MTISLACTSRQASGRSVFDGAIICKANSSVASSPLRTVAPLWSTSAAWLACPTLRLL